MLRPASSLALATDLLNARSDFPWMVGGTVLVACQSLFCFCVNFQSPLAYVNRPKALFASDVYHYKYLSEGNG